MPRMTDPVLVTRLGEEGRLLIISEARCSGGGLDPLAIVRLYTNNRLKLHVISILYENVRRDSPGEGSDRLRSN